MKVPKLRQELDIYPIEYEKKIYFCVKDIEGYQEDILLLTPELIFIASFFNGTNDYEVIKTTWSKNFKGEVITDSDINEAVRILDEKLLLETENFYQAKNRIRKQFMDELVRKPYLSGKSYPQEPEKLKELLDNFFTTENGPGAIEKNNLLIKNIKGFIAPHIDFTRGGYCYAYSYKELAESIKPRKAIIVGVAHSSPPYPYTLLDKDFQTPLGTLKFDRDFLHYLPDTLYKKLIEHQFTHKIEHSIEFQTVWLKHILDEQEICIVPILSSVLPDNNTISECIEFIEVCKKYIRDHNTDVIVIAGADLSHIGPRFGDNVELTPDLLKWMENKDLQSLAHCENIDPEGFLQTTLATNDLRKVCGLSAIYTTLKILSGIAERGKLLKYGYAPDPIGGVVSFSSLIFT